MSDNAVYRTLKQTADAPHGQTVLFTTAAIYRIKDPPNSKAVRSLKEITSLATLS